MVNKSIRVDEAAWAEFKALANEHNLTLAQMFERIIKTVRHKF